jgi:hypothetical protein
VLEDFYLSHNTVYGMAFEVAGRHKLRPELLLAVMFTAGLGNTVFAATAAVPFDPNAKIYGPDVGLYDIANTYTALDTGGYIDATLFPKSLLENETVIATGFATGLKTATVVGWEAVIEFVAASLQMGFDALSAAYASPPAAGAFTPPCAMVDATLFHSSPPPLLNDDGPLVLAIAGYLPRPSGIAATHAAHLLGCLIDSNMRARKWDITDTAGAIQYPTAPDDPAFTPHENYRYQILRNLVATLSLMDCEAFE